MALKLTPECEYIAAKNLEYQKSLSSFCGKENSKNKKKFTII